MKSHSLAKGRNSKSENSVTRYSYKYYMSLCTLVNFWCFFVILIFFEKVFQEYLQRVKQFRSRSGPTFCLGVQTVEIRQAWSGSKLFAIILAGKEIYRILQYIKFSGGSRGGSGGTHEPPPHPPFLNILWKWNDLVSVRPNYFISMGYFKNLINSAKWTPIALYLRTPSQEIVDPPLKFTTT